MRMLLSKLYAQRQDAQKAEMERFYGEKGQISWGNQIRSYVFQPYRMVKDLRTGVETSNVQAVMDGDLDPFVMAGCAPAARPSAWRRSRTTRETIKAAYGAGAAGVSEGPRSLRAMLIPIRIICNWLVWNLPKGASCSGVSTARARSKTR